ncbi:hypothetical protein SDC9_154654 [bioreactor metagenome]|uniref:Uncharacterized protein n=1 Tax=bioreactor metagenome TaxID=1076179 RepID=A0A645F444_9ZZZZ
MILNSRTASSKVVLSRPEASIEIMPRANISPRAVIIPVSNRIKFRYIPANLSASSNLRSSAAETRLLYTGMKHPSIAEPKRISKKESGIREAAEKAVASGEVP